MPNCCKFKVRQGWLGCVRVMIQNTSCHIHLSIWSNVHAFLPFASAVITALLAMKLVHYQFQIANCVLNSLSNMCVCGVCVHELLNVVWHYLFFIILFIHYTHPFIFPDTSEAPEGSRWYCIKIITCHFLGKYFRLSVCLLVCPFCQA